MKIDFDIDILRAVIAATDLGSFARAGIHLGRTQSAISMQLKKLEQQTGTQLFVRKGRKLVPNEAGEELIAYARRIVALNDEAALKVGAEVSSAVVRLGLPQDFFNDIIPVVLSEFSKRHPDVNVEIRAGLNHTLQTEIRAGRLDVVLSFCEDHLTYDGELLGKLPMRWLAHQDYSANKFSDSVPLVLFDHPCLFRKAALSSLEKNERRWRASVTTPNLLFVWSALRSGLGIGVRTEYGLPEDIHCLDPKLNGLPILPSLAVRLLRSDSVTEATENLHLILRGQAIKLLK